MIRLLTICFAFVLFACNTRTSNPSESTGGFETIAPLIESDITPSETPQETISNELQPLKIDELVGTYKLGSLEEGGGTIWVRKQNDKQLAFALEAYRGAPSHNSGFVDGILDFYELGDMVWEMDEFGDVCKLTFRFEQDKLDIIQDGTSLSCGFGANVYAGGTYDRTSSEEPKMPNYENK